MLDLRDVENEKTHLRPHISILRRPLCILRYLIGVKSEKSEALKKLFFFAALTDGSNSLVVAKKPKKIRLEKRNLCNGWLQVKAVLNTDPYPLK